jgi:sterol desaturase/sphingolipid hydroxylase (fatty acid hydroxylase superfamily)
MHPIRPPYPRYLWILSQRSVLLWLLVRITYVVVLMVGVMLFGLLPLPEGISAALQPPLSARITFIATTAILVWWERRRAHEVLLPANLGASPGWFWTASLVTVSVLDMAIQAILQVF